MQGYYPIPRFNYAAYPHEFTNCRALHTILHRIGEKEHGFPSRAATGFTDIGAPPILISRVIIPAQALDRLIPIIGCKNEQVASNWIYRNLPLSQTYKSCLRVRG